MLAIRVLKLKHLLALLLHLDWRQRLIHRHCLQRVHVLRGHGHNLRRRPTQHARRPLSELSKVVFDNRENVNQLARELVRRRNRHVPEVLEERVDRALALRQEEPQLPRVHDDAVRHPADAADESALPVVAVVADDELPDPVQNFAVDFLGVVAPVLARGGREGGADVFELPAIGLVQEFQKLWLFRCVVYGRGRAGRRPSPNPAPLILTKIWRRGAGPPRPL